MLFSSYEFIFFFLPITFFTYFILNKKFSPRAAKIFLVSASIFFYSWWDIKYLPVLLLSIVVNFFIGSSILRSEGKKKKLWLVLGIAFNLSLLGYFKYTDFFIENINALFGTDLSRLNIVLPLGISFFTFQQIAYLVDNYRGDSKEYSFENYTLFVSFFPQLIAGPIVHHKEMMPQFENKKNKTIKITNIIAGLFIFSIGLFKKTVIADTLSMIATQGFDKTLNLTFIEAWLTSLSYTFQLYFDFSGYSDMAIGIALLFNIRLPINFLSPYKSLDIQEFWRRWHITLSRFLRDYIYIPLGGNRRGTLRTYLNIIITFFLGGIWHGAGWLFVLWGLLHGFALVAHRIWKRAGFRMNKILAWFLTFNFVNFAWVLFRAKTLEDAKKVIKGMVGLNGFSLPGILQKILAPLKQFGIQFGNTIVNIKIDPGLILMLIFSIIISLSLKNSIEHTKSLKINYKTAILSGLLFSASILSLSRVSEFLYFNF